MEKIIRITQRGKLIGIFDTYTVTNHVTKNGIKCRLYEIPTGENCFAGYNDFHYEIEFFIPESELLKK